MNIKKEIEKVLQSRPASTTDLGNEVLVNKLVDLFSKALNQKQTSSPKLVNNDEADTQE